jgi:hypothetical protein
VNTQPQLTSAPAGWTLHTSHETPSTGPAVYATCPHGEFVETTYTPHQGGVRVSVCTSTTDREGLVQLIGHLQDALDTIDAARLTHGWR